MSKAKRYKRIKKHLQYFHLNFGIRPPYKIVCDGEFLQAAIEGKIRVQEQLERMMDGQWTTAYSTPCVDAYLEEKGKAYGGALKIAKSLRHLKCRHKGRKSVHECFKLLIGHKNKDHLFVAVQDRTIRNDVRSLPGLPILFINGSTPLMEPPTDKSNQQAVKMALKQTELTDEMRRIVKQAKGPKPERKDIPRRKKRKGPNPLSMKKKKANKQQKTSASGSKGKQQKADVQNDKKPVENKPQKAAVIEGEEQQQQPKEKKKRKRTRVRVRRRNNKGGGDKAVAGAAGDGAGAGAGAGDES